MGLAEDNDVIEAFPADRADQSLRMPVLPGRPRGDRMIAYTHGCKTLRHGPAVAPVTIPDHVSGCFVPREGICELAGDPLGCRMIGDAQRDQVSPLVPQDNQDKQQPKADGRHDQEVHRANACSMVMQKCLPGLRPPRPLLAMYLATVDC